MEYKYTYQIEDFPNSAVNLTALEIEIQDSTISAKDDYLYINMEGEGSGSFIDIFFLSELSTPDENKLNTVVSTHNINNPKAKDPIAFDLPVQGSSDDITFGTPIANPLPSINQAYGPSAIQVLGTNGPDFSNVDNFTINWNLSSASLNSFHLSTNDGNPSWWLNLRTLITHTFSDPMPSALLSGTGIQNFDGEYWVNVIDNGFLMHSKSGNFTIYFTTSSSSYNPTLYNSTFLCIDPSNNVFNSNVPTNVYGTQFNWSESRSLTTTTSNTFVSKVSLTTPELPKGMYNIRVSYGWSQTEGTSYFESRLMLDSSQLGELHRSSPTTAQRFGDRTIDANWLDFSSREFVEILAPGEHTIDLQYRQDGGNTAKIANATIQLFRVL